MNIENVKNEILSLTQKMEDLVKQIPQMRQSEQLAAVEKYEEYYKNYETLFYQFQKNGQETEDYEQDIEDFETNLMNFEDQKNNIQKYKLNTEYAGNQEQDQSQQNSNNNENQSENINQEEQKNYYGNYDQEATKLFKEAQQGIENINNDIDQIKESLDVIEEDILDQRERLLRINAKVLESQDVLNRVEQGAAKLGKIINQDKIIKFMIILIAFIICGILVLIFVIKGVKQQRQDTSDEEFFFYGQDVKQLWTEIDDEYFVSYLSDQSRSRKASLMANQMRKNLKAYFEQLVANQMKIQNLQKQKEYFQSVTNKVIERNKQQEQKQQNQYAQKNEKLNNQLLSDKADELEKEINNQKQVKNTDSIDQIYDNRLKLLKNNTIKSNDQKDEQISEQKQIQNQQINDKEQENDTSLNI